MPTWEFFGSNSHVNAEIVLLLQRNINDSFYADSYAEF